MVLKDVKTLLGIEGDEQDSRLKLIIEMIETRLSKKLGEDFVPPDFDYITTELAVVRFNRIGSEGFTNHSIEGESIVISSEDFKPYEKEIEEYLESKGSKKIDGKRGGFKFL